MKDLTFLDTYPSFNGTFTLCNLNHTRSIAMGKTIIYGATTCVTTIAHQNTAPIYHIVVHMVMPHKHSHIACFEHSITKSAINLGCTNLLFACAHQISTFIAYGITKLR